MSLICGSYIINAFHTKLQRILDVVHPGFGHDITLHYIILNNCNKFILL